VPDGDNRTGVEVVSTSVLAHQGRGHASLDIYAKTPEQLEKEAAEEKERIIMAAKQKAVGLHTPARIYRY
jgi:hypothetical protein